MPRIVPIQLLKCLKVLLDDNGGILSAGEVKRLASLMTKYSKKLVSKCIYVQILKCTKTELLGEFMGAGGWSLVYTWLNDAIRAMNWPLVQEILELLLLCPVDVHRLKINSAPKLVKGLCKDGGNEGVRILARRLVEQWLKVVTENPEAPQQSAGVVGAGAATPQQAQINNMTPQAATVTRMPAVAATASAVNTSSTAPQQQQISTTPVQTSAKQLQQQKSSIAKSPSHQEAVVPAAKTKAASKNYDEPSTQIDPLADVSDNLPITSTGSYPLTPAQKKATEAGLVYKIVVKDGQQVLTRIAKPKTPPAVQQQSSIEEQDVDDQEDDEENQAVNDKNAINANEQKEEAENDRTDATVKVITTPSHNDEDDDNNNIVDGGAAADDNSSSSSDKPEKDNDANSKTLNNNSQVKSYTKDDKKTEDNLKKTETTKEKSSHKEHRSSRDSRDTKERRNSGSSSIAVVDKEKDKEGSSKTSKSSSSSSSHRSSSHKSSSSKSSSSSSSSKSKSSSSSSSRRSSSDKHRSDKDNKDKERSSSSKDKDRSSGSSSKHKSSSSSSKSGSSSSSSKDKHRDKDKERSTSSASSSSSTSATTTTSVKNKDKEREKESTSSTVAGSQSEKEKTSLLDKLSKIPKKSSKDDTTASATELEAIKQPTSITIPSKKASMSIEIRKGEEKAKTVKTYKSQFRSHGLTEEAPPPPSRKGLKKPTTTTPMPGTTILPLSLPSSLKRTSPPPMRDATSEKKAKIDINNITLATAAVVNEKPGAIKLIPAKKIQTLVETNLFSDALSAATGPKKVAKRKRATTPAPTTKDGQQAGQASPPTSPETPKVAPLKFYQDTLDESKSDDNKSDKENDENGVEKEKNAAAKTDAASNDSSDKDMLADDDDDIPLKKVKEDIEQKVAMENKLVDEASRVASPTTTATIAIDITNDDDDDDKTKASSSTAIAATSSVAEVEEVAEVKKPGPGCGPNGPPGVLMLHRRKGPKKKLTWRPQESLEQIRFFESDENERCNVSKSSFMDMQNMDRMGERDAVVRARRGFNQEDNMEPQIAWKQLLLVDDVPQHPEGNQSKQRKIQAEREMTTLRALYFSHALIPDSPAEAEIEPVFNHDVPVIPLDDLTGNPDAVNDFSRMPWPEPKGSPKHGDSGIAGTGGLMGSPVDMFGGGVVPPPMQGSNMASVGVSGGVTSAGNNPFNQFMNPFGGNPQAGPAAPPMQNGIWQPNAMPGNGPMAAMNGPPMVGNGPMIFSGPPHNNSNNALLNNNGPPQNFMNQFAGNNNNPFGGPGNNQFGSPNFNSCPSNFGPMGPVAMMNGMNGPGGPPMGMMNGQNNNRNNRNGGGGGGGNWRSGGGNNFQDSNYRPAGSGPNRGGGGGGGSDRGDRGDRGNNSNSGLCKAFMRGHCRLGKSCRYTHPIKSKRI